MLTTDYLRPVLPPAFPPKLKKIIEQGWLTYPSMRPSAEEILIQLDEHIKLGPQQPPDSQHEERGSRNSPAALMSSTAVV